MSNSTTEPLELHGHSLVPIKKERGSVLQWQCANCKEVAEDASMYLGSDCE